MSDLKILDAVAGTGQLLIEGIRRFDIDPLNAFYSDIDPGHVATFQASNKKFDLNIPVNGQQKTVQIQNTDSTKTTETIANQTLEQQELIIRQQELNNSLILMQQGLSLLAPSPSIRCRNTIMGFTCN